MWRFLVSLFTTIGMFAITFLAVVGLLAYEAKGKVSEAEDYASAILTSYAAEWDETVLLKAASEELVTAVRSNPAVLSQLSELMRTQGGALKSQGAARCPDYRHTATLREGRLFVAGCEIIGDLDRSTGRFQINVIKRGGEWRLLGFFALLEPKASDGPVAVAYGPHGSHADGFGGIFEHVPAHHVSVSLASRRLIYGQGEKAAISAGLGADTAP